MEIFRKFKPQVPNPNTLTIESQVPAKLGDLNRLVDDINTGTVPLPETAVSGNVLVYNGTEWVAGNSAEYTYEIGEYVPSEGGVIFHRYLEAGVENYLVVSIVDQSTSQVWSNIDTVLIGPSAQSTWDGLSNSNAIVGQAGHTDSAAQLCLNLVTGGQNDWYLPSVDELSLVWNSRFNLNKTLSTIGGATALSNTVVYWGSTENDFNNVSAWSFNFTSGDAFITNKDTTRYVRAVRAFTI